jgi:hypothetical protein
MSLDCDADTRACRATRHCTCMLRMQVDTAVAARRHSVLSLSNASLSLPCPTSPLVQLTCTGRGESVQHNTAVSANPTAHLGYADGVSHIQTGKASTVSTVEDLRPKAWTSWPLPQTCGSCGFGPPAPTWSYAGALRAATRGDEATRDAAAF